METKFNKTLILTLLIFLFLSLFTSCFASFSIIYNNTEYTVPDLPEGLNYYLIQRSTNNWFYLFYSNSPITYMESDRKVVVSNGGYYYFYSGWAISRGWEIVSYNLTGNTGNTALTIDTFAYANYDIYDIEDNVVFQGPLSAKYRIPAITETTQLTGVISKTMRLMIPIGLVVFGIGLLIYFVRYLFRTTIISLIM